MLNPRHRPDSSITPQGSKAPVSARIFRIEPTPCHKNRSAPNPHSNPRESPASYGMALSSARISSTTQVHTSATDDVGWIGIVLVAGRPLSVVWQEEPVNRWRYPGFSRVQPPCAHRKARGRFDERRKRAADDFRSPRSSRITDFSQRLASAEETNQTCAHSGQ